MTRDDLFNINAGIVKGLIEIAAEVAPKAYILVISNPVCFFFFFFFPSHPHYSLQLIPD